MVKKIINKYRVFLSLGDTGQRLEDFANTDPRFTSRSAAARHLIELGMVADQKMRAAAMKGVK